MTKKFFLFVFKESICPVFQNVCCDSFRLNVNRSFCFVKYSKVESFAALTKWPPAGVLIKYQDFALK